MPRIRRPGGRGAPAASAEPSEAAPSPRRGADNTSAPPSPADAFARGGAPLPDVAALAGRAVAVDGKSALVNTRVLADAMRDARPATSVGGVKLSGLDLSKVKSGRLVMHLPLEGGTFHVPGKHEPLASSVKPGAKVLVDVRVARGDDGEPRIGSATLTFEPRVTILNPKAALLPSSGALAGAFDWLQDAAGDLHIHGLRLEPDGTVFVDGVVDKPWPLPNTPLNDAIPAGTFPKLNMELQTIAKSGVIKDAAHDDGKQGPGLDALLKSLGAMTGDGVFELDLETDGARLLADAGHIVLSARESPVTVDIEGQVQLDDDGNLLLRLPDDAGDEVRGGFGGVDLIGDVELNASAAGVFSGDGALAARASIDGVSGVVRPYDGAQVPLEICGPGNVVIGKTQIRFDGDELSLKHGTATANLQATLPDVATLELYGTHVDLYGGELKTDAGFSFHLKDRLFCVEEGKVDVRLKSDDARARSDDVRLVAGGDVFVRLHGERIRLDAAGPSPRGGGTLRVHMTPTGTDEGASPLWAEMPFELEADGTLKLSPGKSGLIELIAPVTTLAGTPASLVDPKTPAVGAVGSAALKAHLSKLTGAKLLPDNRVKLLVDGPASRQERLELIRSAQETLFLQTLIFKDDESGRETVKELIAAKERGVRVCVIVDALGNVEKPNEIVDGKGIYQTLRDAGVELHLYNDPATSKLGDLLREVFADPTVANASDFTALLSDPMKAVPLMQRIARIASGTTSAPPETRERLAAALDAVTSETDPHAPTTDARELANMAACDAARATELLTALRLTAEFNNRWHEKYLVVDGKAAVTGGMNIGDEYFFGSDHKVVVGGKERPAWRDTDIAIRGPSATCVHESFARNWLTLTGEDLPPPPDAASLAVPKDDGGGLEMHVLQHRPRDDGDHHITNFMIEHIKALAPGQKAYIANAYFLPTGALTGYKQALIDAAGRDVDVRVVTNSEGTTDLPQLNQAALTSYLELMKAGVRIFERTGEQTMHTKAAVFGTNTATVGSWNADNRSASLNSECLAAVYDEGFAQETERMIERDMAGDVAKELKPADVRKRLAELGVQNQVVSWFANLM